MKTHIILSLIFLIASIFFTVSILPEDKQPLRVSVSNWIGYTPILYAKEKGWFSKTDIEILYITSLAENIDLFKTSHSDAFVGTQYEYYLVKKYFKALEPVLMIDKSNGGDMVISNRDIKELQNDKHIHTYLEINSINRVVLESFLDCFNIKKNNLILHNIAPLNISELENSNKTILIITYIPYNDGLLEKGFKELSNSKNNKKLFVIDALFVDLHILQENKDKFKIIKSLTDKAIEHLNKNPYEFYKTVSPYLDNITYEEFKIEIESIIWLNHDNSNSLKENLNKYNISMDYLL